MSATAQKQPPSRRSDNSEVKDARPANVDRDAERSVLGAMLRDNRVIDELATIIRKQDFYYDSHQKMWSAMVDLWNKAKPVDLVILADELKRRKQLEDVGYPYLSEIWNAVPTAALAVHYAGIVKEQRLLRILCEVAGDLMVKAQDPTGTAEEMVADAERQLFQLVESGTKVEVADLYETVPEALDRINARSTGQVVSGLTTGLDKFDAISAGLQDGELIVVGARPSVGKTSLGATIALHVSTYEGQPVFFVSLEQPRAHLAERLLSMQSGVDSHRLRTGKISSDDSERLMEAGGILRKAPLHIDDTSGQGMLRIASVARMLKRKKGIRLVVVDYIQIVQPEDLRSNRYEQIGLVTRRLQYLSRELKIPIIALAQVGRDAQSRPPRLSDLRESGNQEQDADVVLFLHRPDKVEDEPGKTREARERSIGLPIGVELVECEIAKNRNGRTGPFDLGFRKSCVRFENVEDGTLAPPEFAERAFAP